ncbi:MAG: NADH-quinone oxidoreductase subunit L [Deltaproteobacteria bacterium]|nr:NADH-quinone oxidoreductase subunit L [Deltaproteobacteria bacterium]
MPEKRILLKNCEKIDPGDIVTYLNQGGFKALEKIREGISPGEVIKEVKASGLRGRGGAGFPCGLKWEFTREAKGEEKYVICNADEGEVGTFKDRYILQHNPFSVIEGIIIAAYAVGAKGAYIYLRGEYHYLLDSLAKAIEQVKEKGFLQDLDIQIQEGAGSYVCGEESALMNSIEGKRGEVRYRPPFPATSGLFGRPTVINNVETLMNIPHIILNGSKWYRELGTEQSKGTKLFCVSGDVERPGVYEMELGCDLKELVVDIGGAKDIKMVQVGGSTGKIIPSNMIEMPLCYETVLGSGAVTVFDNSRDVIEFVYRTMEFLNEESCGKCVPCREGTEVMMEILGRLVKGEGVEGDITALEELSNAMMLSSMCGLGQTAPIPVLDTLKYFREEYENCIKQSVFLRGLKAINV